MRLFVIALLSISLAWIPGASPPPDQPLLPLVSPPAGLSPDRVPQFVVFSSDDNFQVAGNRWLVDELFGQRTNPAGQGSQPPSTGARPGDFLY